LSSFDELQAWLDSCTLHLEVKDLKQTVREEVKFPVNDMSSLLLGGMLDQV